MADKETIIGPQTRVSGELRGDEDVVVRGRVEGRVVLSSVFTVEESAIIQADVEARIILISGVVVGNLTALESIRLAQKARVVGDIVAPRVIMEEGATYKGRLDMGQAARGQRRPGPHRRATRGGRRGRPGDPVRAAPLERALAGGGRAGGRKLRRGSRSAATPRVAAPVPPRVVEPRRGRASAGRASAFAASARGSGRRRRRVGSRLGEEEAPPPNLSASTLRAGRSAIRIRRARPKTERPRFGYGTFRTPMCGVIGIFGHPEAANLAYLGLHALQHRGQESAGHRRQRRREPAAHPGDGTRP